MEESASSLLRRLSFESTTTSEFEVVPRERSFSESTVEENAHPDKVSLTDVSSPPSPPTSLSIPALFSETVRSEQGLTSTGCFPLRKCPRVQGMSKVQISRFPIQDTNSIPQPVWNSLDNLLSHTNSVSPVTESCTSDASLFAKETLGQLEQIVNALTLISERCTLLDKKVEKAEQCMDMARKLEEKNRVLQKSLQLANNKVEQLAQEVEKLQKRLSSRAKRLEERQEQRPSPSMHLGGVFISIICVTVAVLAVCVGLLRTRNSLVPEFL